MAQVLSRRAALGGIAFFGIHHLARAAFPDRPVRALVGFPPGSIPDTAMRLLAPGLGERLGQAVVIENRPGATGAIAAEGLARAPADGHTLLMMPWNVHVFPAVRRDLPFDVADVLPVAGTAVAPLVLVAAPSLGVSNLEGLLRVARERGDRLGYGHSGTVASPNLSMALLMQATGIQPTGVTFRGDPEIIANLLSGAVQCAFLLLGTGAAQVREGRLVGLATTSAARVPSLPDVPTTAELGYPSVAVRSWWAVATKRGTPPEAEARLIDAVASVRGTDEFRARLDAAGALPLDLDGPALRRFNAEERDRMVAVLARLGVRPE